ncbi:uncharacterized protein J7T54_006696 [Emericellopsis cladophorae]|uniref:Protein rds1 n=1 Tax=Emericellopsis cladophorae TaxID=2686198 RepID=A0A9P9Y7Z1_9HYPO|nr:uncharacterized protein J7T54_006696 [Emericellopsis cladophorae]KAI6784650.1 hypothetical protein J7T54_006696 [Emericellopsis cladophorae]
MFVSQVALGLAATTLVAAVPVTKRMAAIDDATILNYALTLEHLENTFYREGLAQFSEQDFADAGFDADFVANVKTVAADEADHVNFLTTALTAAGATPVKECTYDFGYNDVKSFLATASILEGVGVSAYLGAAADIMAKSTLTAAGSILTVEARHSAYIRDAIDQAPFAQPFDTPLTYNQVFSLASPFITECPSDNPALPVKAFPALAVQADGEIKTGSTITLLTPDYTVVAPEGGKIFAAFIAVTGPTFVEATAVEGGFTVEIPEGFAGQTYAVLTGCNEGVSDDTTAAGPALIEISS